jgi:hypothetical protein
MYNEGVKMMTGFLRGRSDIKTVLISKRGTVIAQSVKRLGTGWKVRGSNSGGRAV